jgi:hypothetical protein
VYLDGVDDDELVDWLPLLGVEEFDGVDEEPPAAVEVFFLVVDVDLDPFEAVDEREFEGVVVRVADEGGITVDEVLRPSRKKPTPRTTAIAPAPTAIADNGRLLPVE